jgi:hypothetical protein
MNFIECVDPEHTAINTRTYFIFLVQLSQYLSTIVVPLILKYNSTFALYFSRPFIFHYTATGIPDTENFIVFTIS